MAYVFDYEIAPRTYILSKCLVQLVMVVNSFKLTKSRSATDHELLSIQVARTFPPVVNWYHIDITHDKLQPYVLNSTCSCMKVLHDK